MIDCIKKMEEDFWAENWSHVTWPAVPPMANGGGPQKALAPMHSYSYSIMKHSFQFCHNS